MKILVLAGKSLRSTELRENVTLAVNASNLAMEYSNDAFIDLVVIEDFEDEEYDNLVLCLKRIMSNNTQVVVYAQRGSVIDTRIAGIADELNLELLMDMEELNSLIVQLRGLGRQYES